MSGNKTMGIFIAFIAIFIIGFFAIGFAGSVEAPTDATALAQYNNLTEAVEISSTGLNAVMLLLILAMVISAMILLYGATKRR